MATREQALDVLDALASDVDDYDRRCLMGPFGGGPILRSGFDECRENPAVGEMRRFLDVTAPRLMLAGRYADVVRFAESAAGGVVRSEFARVGATLSVSGLLARIRDEIVLPTLDEAATTAKKAAIGGGIVALAVGAVWLLMTTRR